MAGVGDDTDKTWQAITAAMDLARRIRRREGLAWRGESCFLVNGSALAIIINTRNARVDMLRINTDNPKCIELAYADHYLNNRATASAFGVLGASVGWLNAQGYDMVKKALIWAQQQDNSSTYALGSDMPGGLAVGLGFSSGLHSAAEQIEYAMREDKGTPMSPPSELSIYWANEGAKAGVMDQARNHSALALYTPAG